MNWPQLFLFWFGIPAMTLKRKAPAVPSFSPASLKRSKREPIAHEPALASEELIQCVVFRHLELEQWSAFFDTRTNEPLAPWVEPHFVQWHQSSDQIDWDALSKTALPWMRTLFFGKNLAKVNWRLFLGNSLSEWKLPVL